MLRLADKYVKPISHKNHTTHRSWFNGYTPTKREIKKPISQAHFAIGLPGLSIKDKNRIPFSFLANLLGGPAMSSRLNLSLREKHGLVYCVDANYAPYLETGAFAIYFATDPKNLTRSHRIILREIETLKTRPLGDLQLHKAKNQIKGQMALSEENKHAMMLMMAKSQLDLNRIPNINDIFEEIDGITASKIQELAETCLPIEKMSSLAYLPE